MFKQINKQGVRSDRGFIVQFINRFEVEYREGGKVISIYVEPKYTSTEFCLAIKSDSFSCWSDGTLISAKRQNKLLKNFIDAMNFQNISIILN